MLVQDRLTRHAAHRAKPWQVYSLEPGSLLVRSQSISATEPSGPCQCQSELPASIKHPSFMGTPFLRCRKIPFLYQHRKRNNDITGASFFAKKFVIMRFGSPTRPRSGKQAFVRTSPKQRSCQLLRLSHDTTA